MPMTSKIAISALAIASAVVPASQQSHGTGMTPPESVTVRLQTNKRLAVMRDEVTQAVWALCNMQGPCEKLPLSRDPAQRHSLPMTGLNALDAEILAQWLSRQTGQTWRLPSLAEWRDYSAEVSTRIYPKRFTDPRMAWAADYAMRPDTGVRVRMSGAFGSTSNGLRDIDGNIWEWTSTCVSPDVPSSLCPAFVVGGQHEAEIPVFLRDPVNGGCAAGTPPTHLGVRLVRDLHS